MKFKPKTIIVLKRTRKGSDHWKIMKSPFAIFSVGLYQAFLRVYGALQDKDRITKIEFTVTREK